MTGGAGAQRAGFAIRRLGPAAIPSPLRVPSHDSFVRDDARLLVDPRNGAASGGLAAPTVEIAGPRDRLFFEPSRSRAAIATCGGISPGLNVVVRALVVELGERYGVGEILGVRHGYRGLAGTGEWTRLTPADVALVHHQGGSILGTSRGAPPVAEMVDALAGQGIDIFFAVGGDGTLRGALEIAEEIERRGLPIAVVGIPKTIDNDIPWVRRSFGFETAVEVAAEAIRGAHVEATSVRDGVGLVRLMGRNAGYLAATASLASGLVDFCLVPEVPFSLEGEHGLLALIERKLDARSYALVVVAEGAGQEHFAGLDLGSDASGNRKLGDIGMLLRERIESHFAGHGRRVALKYLDPSYLVRSAPALTGDVLHATRLAQNAAHAAMSGRTALLVGYWHGLVTHVPLEALRGVRRRMSPVGELWWNVLESTGQPLAIG